MNQGAVLTFDVGNTRIKAGLFVSGRLRHTFSVRSTLDTAEAAFLRDHLQDESATTAFVSSVVPQATDRLCALLTNIGIVDTVVYRTGKQVFETVAASSSLLRGDALLTPETTGADRIFAALGARLHAPDSHLVIVTAGSAVTVNLVTADGEFRGGSIFPGFGLMAQALNRGTAALPMIDPHTGSATPSPIGTSTETAIRAGIYNAVLGGVERLIREMRQSLPADEPTHVFLTGGDAEFLRRGLPFSHRVRPHLVLEGLYHAGTSGLGSSA